MNIANNPCKTCTTRYPKCHSNCPDYIAAKAEHDRIRQKLVDEGVITGYFAAQSRKKKKRFLKK